MNSIRNRGKERLEERIEIGRQSGARIVEKVMTEVPIDMVVKGKALRFDGHIDDRPTGGFEGMLVGSPDNSVGSMRIHKWPLSQMCSRADLQWKYAQRLMQTRDAGWGFPLLAKNLQTIYDHSNSRYLLRSFEGQLRGFLSDRYRRLDSRPLLESFAGTCKELGAVPIKGYVTDTKVGLSALLPEVYEPVPGEAIAFGVMWENSDYGNGKHMVSGFIYRVWCANGATMAHKHSQVHLGKQLSEDIQFSERTYQLDTATTASAIIDIVRSSLSTAAIANACLLIQEAHENKIDAGQVLRGIKALNKGEVEMISGKYNSPDVEMLPPGNTAWRLSNAVSWVAGNEISEVERQIELMKVAGAIISRPRARAVRR